MSNIVLTLPNEESGRIALNSILNREEGQDFYRYLGDMASLLRGSEATRALGDLPMTFHRLRVKDDGEDSFRRDLLGYHNRPEAVAGTRGLVLGVDPDWAFSLCTSPGSPGSLALQPDHNVYMRHLRADDAHQRNNYGKSGHVAVIDTGAQGVSIDQFYDILDPKTINPGPLNAIDRDGHGSAMAALIREVAPRCTLSVIRISDTTDIPLWHVIAGILLAVFDARAEILNLSLGVKNAVGSCGKCGATVRAFALEYLMKSLRRFGGKWLPNGHPPTFVAATGNDRTNAGFFAPAKFDVSIAVGSLNSQGQLSQFSTFGTYQHSNYIVAPGGEVMNNVETEYPIADGNRRYAGTSVAAAYVSGVLALLRNDDRQADLLQLLNSHTNSMNPSTAYGKGALQYSYP